MKALLGRKLGMTQVFSDDGTVTPVTLVTAGPCTVIDTRTVDKDGYSAVQLGFENAKRSNKPQQKQFAKSKSNPKLVKEFRGDFDVSVGDVIDVGAFEAGDIVRVSGTSKGKGFSGVIKRHNFSRGPMTHGSRHQRRPGSIGSAYPQKIFKGKKMAGRMGSQTVTQKKMKIQLVDKDNNLLAIKGAIPGSKGSLVVLKGDA